MQLKIQIFIFFERKFKINRCIYDYYTLNVIGRINELYCPLKSLANVLKQFLQKFSNCRNGMSFAKTSGFSYKLYAYIRLTFYDEGLGKTSISIYFYFITSYYSPRKWKCKFDFQDCYHIQFTQRAIISILYISNFLITSRDYELFK